MCEICLRVVGFRVSAVVRRFVFGVTVGVFCCGYVACDLAVTQAVVFRTDCVWLVGVFGGSYCVGIGLSGWLVSVCGFGCFGCLALVFFAAVGLLCCRWAGLVCGLVFAIPGFGRFCCGFLVACVLLRFECCGLMQVTCCGLI